jgi:hypothetical protein
MKDNKEGKSGVTGYPYHHGTNILGGWFIG